MTSGDTSHEEWRATLAARKDLGEDYDRAFVDGVVARMSAEIDARVDERLAEVAPRWRGPLARRRGSTFLALSSLVLGIPVTAISGAFAHLGGIAVAWGGIAVVNLAHAWRPREYPSPPPRRR